MINSYGIKIARRTYDSPALNPYRRQSSGVAARRGLWEIRYDPYDISRIWVRNHHDQGFLEATWTHLRTAPAPFGELTWARAREILASRGSDPVTEAEIAAAAADLLDRAGNGPGPGPSGQAPAKQHQAAGRIRSPRSRRVAGRTAATAAPQWPRPAPGPDAGSDEDEGFAGQAAAEETETRQRG